MAKFGELIDTEEPLLIAFLKKDEQQSEEMGPQLKLVAKAMGKKAKIIHVDVDTNRKLAEALKIEDVPSFVIFKATQMVWRQNGPQEADTMIKALQEHV